MKKFTTVVVAALFAASAASALAGSAPGSGVSGSVHDITYLAQAQNTFNQDDYQRVCVFCHTPHNALPSGSVQAPLWNHAPSTVMLNPYVWSVPANLAISFNSDPLVGPSRLCMSCHDGVTAVDSHGSSGSINNGSHLMPGSYTDPLGNTIDPTITDLTTAHPIGFQYQDAINVQNLSGQPAALATQNDHFLTSVPTISRSGGNPSSKKIGDTLYNGYLTCASCHDVHNTNNVESSGSATNFLLWAPNTNSIICLSCHIL